MKKKKEDKRERELRGVMCMKSVKSFTAATGSPIKRVWNVDQKLNKKKIDWVFEKLKGFDRVASDGASV